MCETAMRARLLDDTMPDELTRAFVALGRDISAARRVRNITQHELARRLHASRATVARMERGDHRVSFGLMAKTAWIMGLEGRLLSAFAQEHDPVALREARLALPKRVRMVEAAHDAELDF